MYKKWIGSPVYKIRHDKGLLFWFVTCMNDLRSGEHNVTIECVIPRGSVLCTRVYLPLDSPKYMYIYIAVQSWSGTAEWIKVPYTDDCWTVHFLSLVATYVCQSQRQLREAQWQAWSPSSSQYNQWTSGRAPVWCMHVHIFPRGNMYTTFLKKQNVWCCRFGGGGLL